MPQIMVHSTCSSPTTVKKKIPLVTEQLHATQLSPATMPGVADMPAQVSIHVRERMDGRSGDGKVELHHWKRSERAAGRMLKIGQSALGRNGDGTEGSRAAASAYVLCPFIRACPCISEGRSRRDKVDGVHPEAEG